MHQAMGNEMEFSGEILNDRKDGSAFWNELTISPVHNSLGEVTHFGGDEFIVLLGELSTSRETSSAKAMGRNRVAFYAPA